MQPRDLKAALRAADAAIERHGLPPAAERRLRARLDAHRAGRKRRPLVLLATATACAAAAAILVVAWPRAPRTVGGLTVAAAHALRATVGADATVRIEGGTATFSDPRWAGSLAVAGPARLRREPAGVRVVAGRVEVAVVRRAAGAAPVRILVSDGAIEVTGTRFTVEQAATGGAVTLHEGAIRFTHTDGTTVAVAAGERLVWPRPATAAAPLTPAPEPAAPPAPAPPRPVAPPAPPAPRPGPAPAPALLPTPAPAPALPPTPAPAPALPALAPPAPEKPAGAPASPEALLERLAVLRSRGRYAEAATELEAGLRANLAPATRERLSYELGSIYTNQLRDPRRACAHWRAHERRFVAGRYEREVRQASARLGCERE